MQTITIELPRIYGNNLAAYRCKDRAVILAGPRDTGKTIALLTKLHWLAHRYKGASLVIARKQLTDVYSTVLQTFLKKVLKGDPAVTIYGGEKPQWFDYQDSGARVWIAGLDKPGKVLSGEHDVAYLNQAEELGIPDWEALIGCTSGRAGHMPYSQVLGDCNPAGPTHWIRTRARDGGLTLFESRHQDNPDLYDPATGEITAEGEKRLAALKSLTGARLMRWYHGLWVSPEGAIYDVFDEDKHKIKAFPIPSLWPRVVGIDPFGAYTAAVWAAFDAEANTLHVYREYYQPFGVTTAGHARAILEASKQETIFAWVGGGPSERQQRVDFSGAGIPLLAPPISDVWAGIDRVNQLLRDFALVIHDSCPQLLSEITDYRRKLKDGEPTEAIENKEEYHLCLAARTMITTGRGQIPIEKVTVEDYALTRNGYGRVLAVGQTDQNATVLTAHLSNGGTLTGTPEHPIYVRTKGYIHLRALRYGDIIETPDQEVFRWQQKNSNMMATDGSGIQMQSAGQIVFTTGQLLMGTFNAFIGIFGKSITGLFRKAALFITKMGTQTITSRGTWNACPSLSICHGMALIEQKNSGSRQENTSNPSGYLPQNGIVPHRAESGTGSPGRWPGTTESPSPWSVHIAARSLILSLCMVIPSSVPTTASRRPGEPVVLTTKPGFAQPAVESLPSTGMRHESTAPIHVLRIAGAPSQPVYNLTVDGGEYYANGILTHNCDALRYLCAYLTDSQPGAEVIYNPVQFGPRW